MDLKISNEMLAGMIFAVVVPWCVFITMNIMSLRQSIALIRAELATLNRIQELLERFRPI